MSKTTPTQDYAQLQATLDKVIGKIGLQRTIVLLDSFINNTKVTQNEREKITMITQYAVNRTIQVFELREDQFLISNIREYRDARMCCIHILRKYTNDTFSKIGLFFRCGARIAMYGYTVTEDRLAMPKGNTRFVSNYALIEGSIIDFMGRIN